MGHIFCHDLAAPCLWRPMQLHARIPLDICNIIAVSFELDMVLLLLISFCGVYAVGRRCCNGFQPAFCWQASFGASAGRWDGVIFFRNGRLLARKFSGITKASPGTTFKRKLETKFISLRLCLVNTRAYFVHGLSLSLHRALWISHPVLAEPSFALCPDVSCCAGRLLFQSVGGRCQVEKVFQ